MTSDLPGLEGKLPTSAQSFETGRLYRNLAELGQVLPSAGHTGCGDARQAWLPRGRPRALIPTRAPTLGDSWVTRLQDGLQASGRTRPQRASQTRPCHPRQRRDARHLSEEVRPSWARRHRHGASVGMGRAGQRPLLRLLLRPRPPRAPGKSELT